MAKTKLPKINLPRKYTRLPRVGRVDNPFKAGTTKTAGRVKRAIGAHTAMLAANQVPGKGVAVGALGAKLAGPVGAAAAFAATSAASGATSALLLRSLARRGKALSYLSQRGKRATGVYKARAFREYQRGVGDHRIAILTDGRHSPERHVSWHPEGPSVKGRIKRALGLRQKPLNFRRAVKVAFNVVNRESKRTGQKRYAFKGLTRSPERIRRTGGEDPYSRRKAHDAIYERMLAKLPKGWRSERRGEAFTLVRKRKRPAA